MRLQDKRIFKGINFDDADEFLAEGDTRGMLNVRVGYNESGDDGIVENVKGTISVFADLGFSLPAGFNKCIAECADEPNNRLIWLNYNATGDHGIYAYNLNTNTIDTVLESSTLNFTLETIHSIDILNGNLSWVDENRPRTINVDLAINGTYAGAPIEELITDAKIVPMFPPVCAAQRTFGTDFIQSLKSFQFIYRYVFVGGEKGAWGAISKLVSTGYRENKIQKILLDVSSSEIFTKPQIKNIIEYVEFASRELYTFNFNQFLRISTDDLVDAQGVVEYDDTESKTPVDIAETNIPFYENPIKAGTVCYQNDRKFYADCTEGYDAFDVTPSLSNVNVQVIPASGGIPYLSDCGTHVGDRYLKPGSEYNYSIEFHDGYGRKSGAINLPELVIKTQDQLSNDYKANVLQFGLNLATVGTYPDWAEKFEIIRSDNKSVTFFVQGRANRVLYCNGYNASNEATYINAGANASSLNTSDSGAIELHIDISNWSMYGTNIGYTFTEGDKLTIMTMGGSTDAESSQVFKALKIKELRGSLLIVDYPQFGRTGLNHAGLTITTLVLTAGPATTEFSFMSRFLVGDNGNLLFSRIERITSTQVLPSPAVETPLTYPFPFDNIQKIELRTSNNLYGVSLIYGDPLNADNIDIYVVGENGYFVKGSYDPLINSFGSWATTNTGITSDINCIESSFTNHNKADLILVGDGGVILKYNRVSNTFTPQGVGATSENLNHVYRDGTTDNLIAVGDNGTILYTLDNGDNWFASIIDQCRNLNGIYFIDGYAVAVGDEGLVLYSSDNGATWIQKNIGTVYNLNSVEGDGAPVNRAYIAGDYGYLAQINVETTAFTAAFNTNTSKHINFFQSFQSETGLLYDEGIAVGDLDLLLDVNVPTFSFTSYSSYVSGIYGTSFLNYRAKIEVFSPKTTAGPVVFYETGDAYAVGQNYTFNKGKEGDGDVFLITKDFRGTDWTSPGDIIFSMTPNSNNTSGTWDKDHGRPNIVLLYPEKQERRNIIRFSDKYVQDSKINGLSNFQSANYEPIPNDYGTVRKLTPIESVLLINAEKETATAYIDQTIFKQSDGQEVAAISDTVINNVRKLAGGFGCANPESIFSYLGNAYFYSKNKKAICRYNSSNGLFPISNYKARTYFNNKENIVALISNFEPKFKNALFTVIERVLPRQIELTATTTVGASPYFPTYDPLNNAIWVGNSGGTTISIIDIATDAVIQTITVPSGPRNPVYDPVYKRMYCSCTSGAVVIVDCETFAILNTIVTVGSTRPGTYDSVNKRMYIPNGIGGDSVSVISTETMTLVTTIAGIVDPTTPVYDPVFQRMYVGTATGSIINVISTQSNTVAETIAAPMGTPNNGCYEPNTKHVYFGNVSGNSTVTVVDTENYDVSSITVGSTPFDTTYVSNTGMIYASNFHSSNISIINPITNTVERTLATNGSPRGVSYDTLNDLLIVPNQGNQTITFYDVNNNYELYATVNVGTSPILYPTYIPGFQKIYVSNIGSANVSVISTMGLRETIAFQEENNRWICKYSYFVEKFSTSNMELFSFLNGELWKHNAGVYNNFHGTQYSSQVNPVFVKAPGMQKNYTYIELGADKVWGAPSITNKEGQETFINSNHFEKIQNEWFADIKQDINTPNMGSQDEALINGNFIQSDALNVLLETSASDATKLKYITVYSNVISPQNAQESQ
jgi:YVTN family beta-propeller protein